MSSERSEATVKRYRDWYFGPQEIGGCPGCGEHWKRDRTGQSHSILFHKDACDYLAWIDEEDEKNEATYEIQRGGD